MKTEWGDLLELFVVMVGIVLVLSLFLFLSALTMRYFGIEQ